MKVVFQKQYVKASRQRGMSLSSVARKAGINKSTLQNWANGKLPGNFEQLLRLCEALQITPNELLLGLQVSAGDSDICGQYIVEIRLNEGLSSQILPIGKKGMRG